MWSLCLQASRILQHLQEGDEKVDAALILFTRLATYDTPIQLSPRDERRFRRRLGVKMAFRSDNPTGHYELELALVTRVLAPAHAHIVQPGLDLSPAQNPVPNWGVSNGCRFMKCNDLRTVCGDDSMGPCKLSWLPCRTSAKDIRKACQPPHTA